MREIKFEELKNHTRKPFYKQKKNLDLADKGKKFSYLNLSKKYVRFEILTANDNFKLKNVFFTIQNNKKYFIVHISDNTPISTRSLASNYLMNIKEPLSSIQNCSSSPISLSVNEEIDVIVFNDEKQIFCSILDDIINSYSKEKNTDEKDLIQPSEAGGGVIVKGP
ncbi:hypothetical protein [Polaribacter gangjinensis]|uniref:Uncharacterized protein n=1 Tax=Polaribacter gangjinensis TaxID=574710 RepID=A0A2S7WBC3_9FLAO|nr:hypothetical protein [Polaribacter gangjinensis]PQJ74551.1 hypothetical protein BTO13_04430 [Polaribacter gangjinensis]